MKNISIDEKVLEVVEKNPEIVDTLVKIGFTHLGNPQMLQVVGRVMTIRLAAKNHNIALSQIKAMLNEQGFDIMEDIENE